MTAARPVLGLVTIGQAPRVDVVPDIVPLLDGLELIERGALDDLDGAAIAALRPEPGSAVLVSRLRDGGSATLDEDRMLPLVQSAVDRVTEDGADAILLLCTGHLPGLTSSVPLFTAEALARGAVLAIAGAGRLGILNPEPDQLALSAERWAADVGRPVAIAAADPYHYDPERFAAAARRLREAGVDWIFLDCIGYSEEMRRVVAEASGARVLLARSLAARLVGEVVVAR